MYKFDELREKYPSFIYRDFSVEHLETVYHVTYFFSIPELCDFKSVWEFPIKSEVDKNILNRLFFNLGVVESISYWKCACPQNLIISCGAMSKEQREWWEKLFYNGLGEFLYRNNISIEQSDLVHIMCAEEAISPIRDECLYEGCLVPIGGGKDSVVSLEILRDENIITYCINGNETTQNIVQLCDYKQDHYVAKRVLDSKILELNKLGYLNGHIPFSAVVAFSSFITAYLCKKKYIVLSNENSANETTIRDSFVNHQYSKSFEFEKDFMWLIKSITNSDILYFSLLRPLSEIQIAWIFSKCQKFHKVFRSCNVGSKKGVWCCNCPKCLFVYIILLPFLGEESLQDIFGENLLNKESMELFFRELTGVEENKPFECVGTRKEVLVALKTYIEKGGSSLLTDKYEDFIQKEPGNMHEMLKGWANENNVPDIYKSLIERRLEI